MGLSEAPSETRLDLTRGKSCHGIATLLNTEGIVLLPDVLVGVAADDVSTVTDQRILGRVEVSGQLTVVDSENKPAVLGSGKLASPAGPAMV